MKNPQLHTGPAEDVAVPFAGACVKIMPCRLGLHCLPNRFCRADGSSSKGHEATPDEYKLQPPHTQTDGRPRIRKVPQHGPMLLLLRKSTCHVAGDPADAQVPVRTPYALLQLQTFSLRAIMLERGLDVHVAPFSSRLTFLSASSVSGNINGDQSCRMSSPLPRIIVL